MKTNDKPSAAIIGCGKANPGKEGWAIGHAHAKAYKLADPDIRLLAVDPNPENLAAFGECFGVAAGDLFASTEALYACMMPDVVSICTWPKLHAPQVMEAASRGVRGIICEKPMAMNGREIDEMLEACTKSGSLLAIAHQRCHDANFKLAKELLHSGAIGTDWVVEARIGGGWDMLSWSIHWIDLVSWLFDATPLSVLAGVGHSGKRLYQHAIEDSSIVFAEYPLKRQAVFITGPEHHQQGQNVFIRGSEGLVAIRDGGNAVQIWNQADGYREIPVATGSPQGMQAMVLEMFDALKNGSPMQLDAARSAISTRTVYAAHESARLMKTIEAPFNGEFTPLEVQQHPPRPRIPAGRIVLFADEHFGSGGRAGILEALENSSGRKPELIEASAGLTGQDLADAGVLLLYHTQQEPSPDTQAAITAWIESGKPTVFVHAALGGYKNWTAYHHWAGKIWDWNHSEHPHEESRLVATDERFAAWSEAWLPKDEVFIKLRDVADVEVLVETTISKGAFPVAWISKAHRNVVTWVPGHRREMWSVPAMSSGLIEMIRLSSLSKEVK